MRLSVSKTTLATPHEVLAADRILDIEQKRHCSTSAYWIRIRDEKPFDASAIPSSRAHPHPVLKNNSHGIVPTSITQKSLSTKDATVKLPSPSIQTVQNAQKAGNVGKASTRSTPREHGKTLHDKKSSSLRPRVFHFSNKSKTLTTESMSSIYGVKKSRGGRRDLAVFEEKIKLVEDLHDLNGGFRKGADLPARTIATPCSGEEIHIDLKTQTAVSKGGDPSASECLPEALNGIQATSRLRNVDGPTICPSQAGSQEISKERISDPLLQPQIKVQPKPAAALRKEDRASPTTSENLPDAQNLKFQDEFVYDTYLRTKLAMVGLQSDCPMDIDQMNMLTSGKVGILVIAEQDEEAWEAYGEEEESDKDWNSEEEDENGMYLYQLAINH